LKRVGCKKIFEEKESGRAGTKRPAFEAALAYLRPEGHLVVWKVDRLGRSLREMLDTAHMLQSRSIKLRSLTEQVDTETATGRLMFNFLGTIAEYFLDLNRERTLEGLRAALARGRKGGRRRKLSAADEAVARAMLKARLFRSQPLPSGSGSAGPHSTRIFQGRAPAPKPYRKRTRDALWPTPERFSSAPAALCLLTLEHFRFRRNHMGLYAPCGGSSTGSVTVEVALGLQE
jgi:DNA invertase Pin-like site-specific DNA recombinase